MQIFEPRLSGSQIRCTLHSVLITVKALLLMDGYLDCSCSIRGSGSNVATLLDPLQPTIFGVIGGMRQETTLPVYYWMSNQGSVEGAGEELS
jgi:hypothetical protein